MTDFALWLGAIELIGIAFLPLAAWVLRPLPDRGYIFAKVLGLLLITYVIWLIGSALPVARSPLLAYLVLAALGVLAWAFLGSSARDLWRNARRLVLIEEALFVGALAAWSLLRVYTFGSGIAHTEQFQDMAFLNASLRSSSFPPFDPWMSGHTINYYYFGYLMFAMLTKISGISASVGYNLTLSLIFATCVAGCYSIGYALTRRVTWALLAPLFVVLIGNWHAALWQVPHAGCAGSQPPGFYSWLFESTRVVGGHFTLNNWACSQAMSLSNLSTTDYTINEFPLFSLVLGDLHPHVLALPAVLLVIALGLAIVCDGRTFSLDRSASFAVRFLIVALGGGALFAINSWDFPTYLLLLGAGIGINGYLTDDTKQWWKAPLLTCAALGACSLVLFAPFYLHFRSLAHGMGPVTTPTNLFEFVQVFGFCLLTAGLLVVTLHALLRPVEEESPRDAAEVERTEQVPAGVGGERGSSAIGWVAAIVLAIVVAVVLQRIVLALVIGLAVWSFAVLTRVLSTEKPNRSDAFALLAIVIACLALAFTEVRYIRDAFDGGGLYRMNTVFKFYYQAWVLLSLAGAYGVFRAYHVLHEYLASRYTWVAVSAVALGLLAAGVDTWYLPTYAPSPAEAKTLDGMAWLRAEHPDDYAAISWLRAHASGTPVILESTLDDYKYHSRVSTFAGLPTVMGWPGHESQWRPWDGAEIAQRVSDIRAIYTTPSISRARSLLRKYDVRFVYVGDQELADYGQSSAGLRKFARFMKVAYSHGRVTIYAWT